MGVNCPYSGKSVLVSDGMACAAAAAVVSLPAVYRRVDPSLSTQPAVRAGLLATSGLCLVGAVTSPSRALRPAAVINAGWVATCLYALKHQRSWTGRSLISGTALFDAVAGYAQWRLSADSDRR